jgi:hypothetical protein
MDTINGLSVLIALLLVIITYREKVVKCFKFTIAIISFVTGFLLTYALNDITLKPNMFCSSIEDQTKTQLGVATLLILIILMRFLIFFLKCIGDKVCSCYILNNKKTVTVCNDKKKKNKLYLISALFISLSGFIFYISYDFFH